MIVFWTIAAAIGCWATGELARGAPPARFIWAAGAAFAIVHSIAAFGVFHAWSHDAAYMATAQQTEALTGLAWGGGLFINYAFLVIWAADAVWWCASPRTYETRSAIISGLIRGFLFFMFFNGAIVFADGWMRVLGLVAVSAVGVSWLIKSLKPARAAA